MHVQLVTSPSSSKGLDVRAYVPRRAAVAPLHTAACLLGRLPAAGPTSRAALRRVGICPEQAGRQRLRTRARHRGGSSWGIHAWRSGHGKDFHDGLVLSGGRCNATLMLMQLEPANLFGKVVAVPYTCWCDIYIRTVANQQPVGTEQKYIYTTSAGITILKHDDTGSVQPRQLVMAILVPV